MEPEITEAVLADLATVRASGAVNMANRYAVREAAWFMKLRPLSVFCGDVQRLSQHHRARVWTEALRELDAMVDGEEGHE